jgi:hypothetical protein
MEHEPRIESPAPREPLKAVAFGGGHALRQVDPAQGQAAGAPVVTPTKPAIAR